MTDLAPDVNAVRQAALAMLRDDPTAREPHLRMYEIEQMQGRPQAAVAHLRLALASGRIITTAAKAEPNLTVLALYRAAPWEANLPFELIVDENRTTVHKFYLLDDDDESVLEQPLPPHDIVLSAIAESDAALPALRLAEALAARSKVPVVNRPAEVARLGREGIYAAFAHSKQIFSPKIERVRRDALAMRPIFGPIVARPVGSQAGVGLARIDDVRSRANYLAERHEDEFFVAPFVEYRQNDGYYRKYRIIFIDREPFAYHLAISQSWMIHYYNAPMTEHAWMREEEAHFLHDPQSIFHTMGTSLREISDAIPITYFGIDCALAPDGRLLLFEADAAMLVHGTDDPALFQYKREAFLRIQEAFATTLVRIAAGHIAAR